VYIGISGVSPAVSPKSYAYTPRVSVGQAAGSVAMNRVLAPLRITRRRNGNVSPPKFEPPPMQAITTSGSSPAIPICASASCPITVWCSSTWLSTEPSA
jgi:hypothetical protein